MANNNQDNTNNNLKETILKFYNESEHQASILLLSIGVPIYLISLFLFYDLTAVRGIIFSGLLQGSFYALIALGFAIIFGIARMFKLSIGAYYVLGAYCAYWLNNVLFMQYSHITLSDYDGMSRVSFSLLFLWTPLVFLILSLLYFKAFNWKVGSLNLALNFLLFVAHRTFLVQNFGSANLGATFQALAIQIGIMAFGLSLYYLELSLKQISTTLVTLNTLALLLNVFGTTPKSPALYISVLLISVLIVAIVSMLIDRFLLEKVRHNQTNVLIITFGIALLVQSAIPLLRFPWRPSALAQYEFIPFGIETRTLDGIVPKPENMVFLGHTMSSLRVFAAIVSLILVISVYFFITYTRMGRAMKAVSEDPEAAWLVGINVRKVYMVSAGIGMGLSAASGVLTSPFAASPLWNPFMGWIPLIFAIAVVTLGGIGSIFGSTIAAFIVGFTEAQIASSDIDLSEIVPLFVIFVIIIIRPRGLFGVEVEEE